MLRDPVSRTPRRQWFTALFRYNKAGLCTHVHTYMRAIRVYLLDKNENRVYFYFVHSACTHRVLQNYWKSFSLKIFRSVKIWLNMWNFCIFQIINDLAHIKNFQRILSLFLFYFVSFSLSVGVFKRKTDEKRLISTKLIRMIFRVLYFPWISSQQQRDAFARDWKLIGVAKAKQLEEPLWTSDLRRDYYSHCSTNSP